VSWLSRITGAEPGGDDARTLQAALLAVLAHLQQQQKSTRLGELEKRLERFPTPTGLTRELSKVLPTLRPPDAGADMADAVSALGAALAAVSMGDEELQREILSLRKRLPTWVGSDEARWLSGSARSLERFATPVRQRVAATERELLGFVTEIGQQLSMLSRGSDSVGARAGDMARRLHAARDAEALAALREDLVAELTGLERDARGMRAEIDTLNTRAVALERHAHAQAAELEEARRAVDLDTLTGVATRGAFDRELAGEVQRARRRGDALSLLMVDVDHFKRVNDTHGHPAGDAVLRSLSASLMQVVRTNDLVARLGGEEFAILLPGTDAAGALIVAEKCREAVARLTFRQGASSFAVTVSVGVAELAASEGPTLLYQRADAALYAAKRGGRDRAVAA